MWLRDFLPYICYVVVLKFDYSHSNTLQTISWQLHFCKIRLSDHRPRYCNSISCQIPTVPTKSAILLSSECCWAVCNCWENTCTFVTFLIFFLQHQTLPCWRWKKTPGSSWYIAQLRNNKLVRSGKPPPVIRSTEVTQRHDIFSLSMPRRTIVNTFFLSSSLWKLQIYEVSSGLHKIDFLQGWDSFSDHLSSFLIHLLAVILIKPLPFDWNAA